MAVKGLTMGFCFFVGSVVTENRVVPDDLILG